MQVDGHRCVHDACTSSSHTGGCFSCRWMTVIVSMPCTWLHLSLCVRVRPWFRSQNLFRRPTLGGSTPFSKKISTAKILLQKSFLEVTHWGFGLREKNKISKLCLMLVQTKFNQVCWFVFYHSFLFGSWLQLCTSIKHISRFCFFSRNLNSQCGTSKKDFSDGRKKVWWSKATPTENTILVL